MGLCQCGCGRETKLATQTSRSGGRVKGQSCRFLLGHHPRSPIAPRFWQRVEKTDGCWEWMGGLFPNGYGQTNRNGKPVGAHRISWELHNGLIPRGLSVLHRCDNRVCVRPDHLFLGTPKDNAQDSIKKGRWPTGSRHWAVKAHLRRILEEDDSSGNI